MKSQYCESMMRFLQNFLPLRMKNPLQKKIFWFSAAFLRVKYFFPSATFRLSFAISFTENEIENIQASEASISDADIAAEVTAFTRAQILVQAATAMLAQANILPQNALLLLQ